jgi:hypothetical protein
MVAVLHAVIKEADSSVLGAADHTSTPRLSKVFAISSGMRIIFSIRVLDPDPH